MSEVACSVKEAKKLLNHLNDDDLIILSVFSKKTFVHNKSERIKKNNGEKLIDQAKEIKYQNNDYFGRLSLYGVMKETDIIHNLLFQQMEQLE